MSQLHPADSLARESHFTAAREGAQAAVRGGRDLREFLEQHYKVTKKRQQKMFWGFAAACRDDVQTVNNYDWIVSVYGEYPK